MSRPRAHSPPPAGVEAPGPGSPRGVSVEHLPSLHAGLGARAPAAHTRADVPASGQRLVVPSSSPRTRHGPPAPPPASGERAASQPRPDQPPCPQAGPRADSPQDTVHTDRAPGCGQADLSLGLGTGLPSKPVPAPTAPGPLRVYWAPVRLLLLGAHLGHALLQETLPSPSPARRT